MDKVNMKRIGWVDMLRGFSILCILYFHTEMYYAGTDVVPYAFYVDGVLSTFFFLSGYLMLKGDIESFDWKHKLMSIVRKLMVPYFIFTLLIAFPKAYANGQAVDVWELSRSILTGDASWFVSALIVAEVFITLLLSVFRTEKLFWTLLPFSFILTLIWGNRLSPNYFDFDFWNYQEAILGCFFMSAGVLFRLNEAALNKYLNQWILIAALLIGVVITKVVVLTNSMEMIFGPVVVSSLPLFVVDNILTVFLLVALFRKLPYFNWLGVTGQHSLVIYFFCGGVPLLVCKVFNALGITYSALSMVFVFPLVCAFASLIAFIIYRYLPFLVGVKRQRMDGTASTHVN